MSTTDPNVSPIIDLSRLNLITVKNNIQNGGFTNDDVSIISPSKLVILQELYELMDQQVLLVK